jgi:hypothetical protein
LRACQLVRNGRIGKVQYVGVGLPHGGKQDRKPPMKTPDALEWDW